MTECLHDRDRLREVIVQQPDGTWCATFLVPGRGLLLQRVTYCPWCGVALWGKPAEAPIVIPGDAHATLPKGTPWPRDDDASSPPRSKVRWS